jgi:predicted CxxxxCH...CXXCH cytochrome family protein
MRSTIRFALASLAAAAALAGCGQGQTIAGPESGGGGGGGTVVNNVPLGDPSGGNGGPTGSIDLAACTACHGTSGFTVAGADPIVSVAPPVDTAGSASSAAVGAHRIHLTGSALAPAIECASCHLVPTAFPHGPQKQGNVSFSRLATTEWAGPAITTASFSTSALTCSNTYCHGNFRNGANASPTWSAAGSVTCGSCHGVGPNGPGGSHPTGVGTGCGTCHPGYTNTTVNLATHMNGVLNVNAGESTGGSACGGCHGTILAAMDPSAGQTSVHRLKLDNPADDTTTWSAPLSAVAATGRSCVNMCHADHPHDLTSPVVSTHEYNVYVDARTNASRGTSAATRDATNRAKTDYTSPSTNPSGGMCLSCHQSAVDTSRAAVSIAGFDLSPHNATTTADANALVYSWQYQLHSGNFDRNCTKCHASRAEGTTPGSSATGSGTVAVHYGNDPSLLAGKTNPGGSAAGFVCFNCHGATASPIDGAQGDRSGVNLQGVVAKAHAHPVNADAVHDGSAELANAAFGNALGVAAGPGQRHVNCLDCHDPHQAQAGDHSQGQATAGPPLTGAWGVAFVGTIASGALPASGNFTKKVLGASDLEASLCFKCHSAFYGTLPTSPSSGSPGFAETDQVQEFNPSNLSFHPVLDVAPNPTSNVTGSWATTSRMTCSDCHGSDSAADPNGPHGSAASFLLKGPNTTWGSVQMTSTGMPAGTFCANCHAANFANSRFPAHDNGHHNFACTSCHLVIPHGSGHRGLLASQGTAGTPEGKVFTDNAPWANGQILHINAYPTGGNNWSPTLNCGCGGTGHP